jgi:putative hydrolase of the HAD superfamily
MAIKAIFFDIDDTLYDSTKLSTFARKNSVDAMIDAGLPGKSEEVYKVLEEVINRFGANYGRHYDELLKMLDLTWDPKIIAAGVVAYERTKVGYLKPYPGVVPLLLKLKQPYRLGIISNGLAVKQWEKLIGLGIHHLFDTVATSGEHGFEKPREEIFEFAMERLDAKPGESIMVGDRLDTDIFGGKRAGMTTVRLKRGKYADKEPVGEEQIPDHEIFDLSEILGIMETEN